MQKIIWLSVVLGFCSAATGAFADGKSAGAATRTENPRAAFERAMVEVHQSAAGSTAEAEAMGRAIEAAQALPRPPAVPDAVYDHVGRAEAAARLAGSPRDFLDAANAFGEAVRLAPWVATYHFNRGVVLEKAQRYDEAERSLGLYLKAAPDAKDAAEVRKRLAGLRYAKEKAARDKAEAAETEKREMERRAGEEMRRKLARFNGPFEDDQWMYVGTAGESSLEIKVVGFKGYDVNGQFRKSYFDGGFRGVFRLSLAGDRVSGTYYQPVYSSTHPVSGVLNADGSLRLDYTESKGRPPGYKDSDGLVFRERYVSNETKVLRPPR